MYAMLQYFVTVPCYSAPFAYIPCYSTLLKYLVTVPCYSTLLQYFVTVHCYSTLLQYLVTTPCYNTLLQCLVTLHLLAVTPSSSDASPCLRREGWWSTCLTCLKEIWGTDMPHLPICWSWISSQPAGRNCFMFCCWYALDHKVLNLFESMSVV